MPQTVYIVEEIEAVVAKTNILLTERSFNKTVYYDYGHEKEIAQRLLEKTKSPLDKNKKFPLLILVTDIPVDKSIIGFYGVATIRLLICNITEATYTAQKRKDLNFKPILHPIKEAFIETLERHGRFAFESVPTYTETECYFYGSIINDKNVFADKIDAIEITNLKIGITEKIC